MAGHSGQLYTGHCVIRLHDNTITYRAADATCTTVNFGVPASIDLDAYIAHGEPLTVAGGFTLDGLGGWFIDSISGDPSTVMGIGLPLTRRLLQDAGLSLMDLWGANPLKERTSITLFVKAPGKWSPRPWTCPAMLSRCS